MTEEEILELCRALEEYKEALEVSENEILTLQDRIASLEESHDANRSDDRSRTTTPIRVEVRFSFWTSSGLVVMHAFLQELEESLLQLDTELANCRILLDEKSREIDDLRETKASLEEVLANRHDDLNLKQDRTIQALRAEVFQLRSKNEAQERELQASSDTICSLTAKSTELQEKVRQLLSEQSQLRDDNISYKMEIERYKNEVDRMCTAPLRGDGGSSASGSEGTAQSPAKDLSSLPSHLPQQTRRHSSYTRSEWEETYGMEEVYDWFSRSKPQGISKKNTDHSSPLVDAVKEADQGIFLTPLETIDNLRHGHFDGHVHRNGHGQSYHDEEEDGKERSDRHYETGGMQSMLLSQTHPYYPHHPSASSLWQAAVTRQNV